MSKIAKNRVLKWLSGSIKKEGPIATKHVECEFRVGQEIFFLPHKNDISSPICSSRVKSVYIRDNESTIKIERYWERDYFQPCYYGSSLYCERTYIREQIEHDIKYPDPRVSFNFEDKDLFTSYKECVDHVAELVEEMHVILDKTAKQSPGNRTSEGISYRLNHE